MLFELEYFGFQQKKSACVCSSDNLKEIKRKSFEIVKTGNSERLTHAI